MKNEIKYADLFGGIGGFRLGIEKSGINARCVFYSDLDKYSVKIYNKNFKENHAPSDIRKVGAGDVPEIDMLCGGFPCQAFSLAGRREGFRDPRGTLFFEIARIIEAKRPKIVFLENVKGLLSHEKGQTFACILQTLEKLGYDAQWMVLNSRFFGVPQNRERVFIIGHSRAEPTRQIFPIRETGELSCSENRSEQKAEKRIRSRHIPLASTLEASYGKTKSLTNTVSNTAGGLGGKTGLYQVQPLAYLGRNQKNYDNTTMLTIDGRQSTGLREGQRIRRLTPTECERLQGFPDGWTQKGLTKEGKEINISDSQRYKVLGNAVTTNVIEFLGKHLSSLFYA